MKLEKTPVSFENEIKFTKDDILGFLGDLTECQQKRPEKFIDEVIEVLYEALIGFIDIKEEKRLKDYFIKAINKQEKFHNDV